MKRLVLGFVGAMALLTGNAVADGMKQRAPACCDTARPWTGFYVGVGVGAAAVVHDLTIGPIGFDGIGGEGVFGTVIVGYDRQLAPNWVGGIFTDFDFSGVSTDLSIAGLFNASVEHKNTWSVGARLGMLTSPSTLWYGVAGYTQAQFEINSTIGGLDLPDFAGYFVGGGVESQLRDGWGLRAEYRFTQFDREDIIAGVIGVEPSMHSARLALTYKWGRDEVAHVPMK